MPRIAFWAFDYPLVEVGFFLISVAFSVSELHFFFNL